MKNSLIAILFLFLLNGCGKQYYLASDFTNKTANHQIIAVLPVEMIFTGTKPKNVTDEDIAKIEEAESKAYMISLNDAILNSTKRGKKPLRVSMLSYTATLDLLQKNNLTIRQAWLESPKNLAAMLGVDAVVQSRIYKQRYLSDLASFGIDLGTSILNEVTQGVLWPFIPNDLSKTNDIKSNFTLISGTDGAVLYSRAFTEEADWNRPANQIIDRTTVRFAKFFPYRAGKN